MSMAYRTDLLTLCHDLANTGIWLSLKEEGGLIAGPTPLVQAHPDLLERLKTHKEEIIDLLDECLAHTGFGVKEDERFEREECPDCHQQVFIVLGPRRLGVHRLPGNTEVCPGSERAQATTAATLMQAFITDRCHLRKGALLTWMSIRGALSTWCAQRSFLLPPRLFLWAWMDEHFTRVKSNDEYPYWEGLQLRIEEWFGENEHPEPSTISPQKKKALLKA